MLSKFVIGGMRFANRANACETIRAAIDAGFNYIDTCPMYCRENEDENSESWVGEAVNYKDYRERVFISTKSSPGNGGLELGEFQPELGFGVRNIEQVEQVFNQSLKRLNIKSVDFYHLWTTHTQEQFDEAMKQGGWNDGVLAQSAKWNNFGLTTHADSEQIIKFLETGKFKTITLPLSIINRARVKVLDYCKKNNIAVIAMNPMGGGFIAQNAELKELALRYLVKLETVHILVGFSSVEDVNYAKWILDTMDDFKMSLEDIISRADELLDTTQERCSGCGYCQPCPQNITIGYALSFYNFYKYMNMKEAKEKFLNTQWNDELKLDKCIECGQCEKKCPNKLSVVDIIRDAKKILYDVKS